MRSFGRVLCSAFFLVSAVVAASTAEAYEFWVSPDGDDSGSGSESAPFRTLEQARDAARALTRPLDEPVVIYVRGGVYRLEQPLTLDARDSGSPSAPVIYRGIPGETARIWGSVRIDGWTLYDAERGIYVASVASLGAEPARSRQFYVNGVRGQRARTRDHPASFVPSFVPDFLPIPPNRDDICDPPTQQVPVTGSGGIEYVVDPLNPAQWRDPMQWQRQSEIEAVILAQWKSMRVRVARVTKHPGLLKPNSRVIEMQTPGWWNANMFRAAPVEVPLFGIDVELFPTEDGKPALWSFFKVSYFENALAFLDEPGEWYLNEQSQQIFYRPRPGEDLDLIDAELPILEALVEVQGTADAPVKHIRFENLEFAYATWLGPSSPDGYVSDQSGFHVVGEDHLTNFSGHVEQVRRTPGNLRFHFSQNLVFQGNRVLHMGGVGLDAGAGSQQLLIADNRFEDIASAAIQLGGVQKNDARPDTEARTVRNNQIVNNRILHTGQDYFDSAAIFVGFAADTLIANNRIAHVPWSGIALGWGWGLLDPGSFPGVSGACSGDWGQFTMPTINRRNLVLSNRIEHFLEKLWDGGAIYTLGQQGPDPVDGLVLAGNVASHKRPEAGSNIFYTDGGSRYIELIANAEFDNPIGYIDFGPSGALTQQLPNASQQALGLVSLLRFPYGSSIGGCRTFGENAYWLNFMTDFRFYDPCGYQQDGISYPTSLSFLDNFPILFKEQVPAWLLESAGTR